MGLRLTVFLSMSAAVKISSPDQSLPVVAEFLHTPTDAGRYCHAASLARTSGLDLLATW